MKHLFTTLFIFTLLTSPFTLQSHAATVQLLQTGQTTCYNEAGTATTCTGTGQDGELQKGLSWPKPRFLDNGDLTVTDKLTGLIWSKNANPAAETKTWQEALDYIKTLNSQNYQGHNDWRLPNINELASMVNRGQIDQTTWLNGQGFTSVQSYGYWSGSTYVEQTVDFGSSAWIVGMDNGYVRGNYKRNNFYVWPVRSGQSGAFASLTLPKTGQTNCYNATGSTIACSGTGQDGELQTGTAWPIPRFTDNSLSSSTENTVTDNLTGLIWSKDANHLAGGPKTWQQALDYIKTLNSQNYQGHNDWRLPNINELASMVNKGQIDQSIWLNEQGFTSVGRLYYWSGSTYVDGGTSSAWYVSMYSGDMGEKQPNDLFYVWPVRSGQSTLSVTKIGTGTGTITSSTGGINCGSTCSASISTSTTVTITATPASGSTFTGWTGACSGTGVCTVTMDAAKSVTATFTITATPTNGTCGISNGATFANTPATGFCTVGTASTPTGTGPWYWTCAGTNGGTTANCSASFGSTPATGTASKAKVYLGVDDVFHAGDSGLTVYGGSGYDTVIIAAGISGITLDQNIERINLSGSSNSYKFKQTGNKINVFDTAGTSLLVNVPVQGDSDGTLLGFSDGYASAKLTAGVMSLGGVAISSSAPGGLTPSLQQ